MHLLLQFFNSWRRCIFDGVWIFGGRASEISLKKYHRVKLPCYGGSTLYRYIFLTKHKAVECQKSQTLDGLAATQDGFGSTEDGFVLGDKKS